MFPTNLLLAYQLENYQNMRFLRFVYNNFKFRFWGSDRQKLDLTSKAILILILSVIFFLFSNILIFYFFQVFVIISAFASILLFPIILIFSNVIFYPIDLIAKYFIIQKAKNKLKKYPNVKIIGITGSFGKTTTKEYLKNILSVKYNIIATPGTHNTPLGISRFILGNLDENTEIMIIEMGAYQIGDIQVLCNIVKPDIGILTGITYQHLERFGSLENIIQAKFELPKNLKKGGMFVFDNENENIQVGLEKYKKELSDLIQVPVGKLKVEYLSDLQGISFEFENNNFTTKLLAGHNAKNLSFAISVASRLGVEIQNIRKVIQNIDFVPHRMQLLKNPNEVYIIDDSFNGNLEGVKSTLEFLRNINIEGKKIYLTPGLVELGNMNEKIHTEIGKLLSDSVDVILLIENNATKYIKIGLENSGFDLAKVKIYKNTLQAHNDLPNILRSGDLIVFQNDWADNHF